MSRQPAEPRPDLVIRNGTVVDSTWEGPADVFIAEGRIVALGEPGARLAGSEATEIDATGRLVLPGGVDPHCHVGFTSGAFTSKDDYAQCTTAAVFGGTTTIVDFAIPSRGETPADKVAGQREAASQGLCDSALHACVTEWDDTTEEQLASLVADGIVTVKMFTTYRGESMASSETILSTMKALKPLGGMAWVHCESNVMIEDAQARCAARNRVAAADMPSTRPELAETASVAEVVALAESAQAPVYIVHQSTPAAVEVAAAARRRGVLAVTEVVTHHLTLPEDRYAGPEPERFVCSPPLRRNEEVAELGSLLFTGEVATIGSDHCCYDLDQKRVRRDDVRAMPNGLPGVETRLPVIFSEFVANRSLPRTRFVELTAANPARVNGLYPRKGSLMPGADADIAIWNPSEQWMLTAADLHMATDYTPYEGRVMTGRPETVLVGGRVVVHDGALVDSAPRGRHIRGRPFILAVGC